MTSEFIRFLERKTAPKAVENPLSSAPDVFEEAMGGLRELGNTIASNLKSKTRRQLETMDLKLRGS
jgi:BMFP domain-containing protein YqiC